MKPFRYSLIFLLLLSAGCYKTPKTDCDFHVVVTCKPTKEDKALRYTDTKAYAFYNDTVHYVFESYAAARQGLMKSTDETGNVNYSVEGTYDRTDTVNILPNLVRSPLTLVVCDTINRIYAYKQAAATGGLDKITLRVALEPYHFLEKDTTIITREGWIIKK